MKAGALYSLAGFLLATGVCGCREGAVSTADKAAAVQSIDAFALDLYAHLRTQPGNLFLSPASISSALAMTYAGARGKTAEEMAATLRYTLEKPRLHPALGALMDDLGGRGQKRDYQLSIASALWSQQGKSFLPEFLATIKHSYGAGVEPVDFHDAPESARQTINAWVAKQTQDKIKELLARGVIDADTRLVLTNAIYFQGMWKSAFKKQITSNMPFHIDATHAGNVPMMHQTHEFGYFQGDAFQALELPYAGDELSMVVFLPRDPDGLADFEKTLSAAKLQTWLGQLQKTEVNVLLPRFRMTAEFALKPTLASMGMADAFSDQADFSGMDGTHDLALSAVVHKAYVAVHEEGTEAAGATAVAVKDRALVGKSPPVFQADHSFFFVIRDRRSGCLLFIGRLADPQ